ncbi:prefoldin subunit 5 [Neodiprion pinetum]|uniref:Prefoldin subunit 5 n=1 Tax=Neodiprion lecontei TaxID=441921 RepID=A0A6J0CDC7_NEOLC|nr:prefoldin subunit 5 [Neodiprion lecontei]XP_046415913.1 prefoldin subunit 5 [Neodiprion fabricii]XP_046471780.1 prefoldin subunit 5 [Neodiprion pinetum]XP_046609692.1 prefoldin subunit 5 [Neodiprion virginianus]
MSQISATEGPMLQQIDLTKLNLQQLTQLKQQLDQELGVFQDSLQTLKIAQNKFQESGTSLEKLTPSAKGKEILVPLTGSMYVTGKLADTETVIVDIGTGYYAQKDIQGAKDYFKRRVNYVTEQMEKIQQIGLEKSKIREAIMDVMEMKIQGQMSTQKELAETA